MEKYKELIPLSDIHKKTLVNCVNDGIYRYKMCQEDYPTPTHNGNGHNLWNFINGQVNDAMPENEFSVLIRNKNSWEFVIIYEKNSHYLYLLTRDENYKSLRNQKDKRLLHYFNAFSKLNACLLGQYEIKQYQYSFFNEYLIYDDPDIINMLGADLTKMLRDFNEEIKRFVLVCFSQREDKVEKIYAEVPVYGFRTVYTELWNYVLSAEYDTMTNDKDHNIYYDDSEINISLRDEEYADEPNLEMKEVGQAQENI